MGDIAPSKVPKVRTKVRTIRKKGGNLPVSLYAKGGKVKKLKMGGALGQ